MTLNIIKKITIAFFFTIVTSLFMSLKVNAVPIVDAVWPKDNLYTYGTWGTDGEISAFFGTTSHGSKREVYIDIGRNITFDSSNSITIKAHLGSKTGHGKSSPWFEFFGSINSNMNAGYWSPEKGEVVPYLTNIITLKDATVVSCTIPGESINNTYRYFEFLATMENDPRIDSLEFIINSNDNQAPSLNLSLSPNSFTNSSVTINAIGSDNVGVSRIQTPDGNWTNGSNVNYTVSSNGTYNFAIQDTSGNTGYKSITVSNIDTSPPTATSAIIQNQDENGYDVYVYGASDSQSGVNRVQFPTWTDYNGQDDIQPNWGNNSSAIGTNLGNGTWMYHVNKSNHNNEMGQYHTYVYVYDNANNYKCVSTLQTTLIPNDDAIITSNDIPTSMESGNTYTIHVTVKNVGGKTWDSNYRLGGINDSDPFANGRQYLPSGTTIAPGQSYTFIFNMIAPAIPNTYITDWQMVHESVRWFGSTISKNVTVSDTIAPSLALNPNITSITNSSITITATGFDSGSGVKQIKLPNNNWIIGASASYVVDINGTYTFVAYDNAGNATTQSITISNIDKTPPVITIGAYNTNPTNQNITVTASTNEGTLNATSHTFTANGSFDFIATDSAGNKTTKTITISNIDKTLPIITTAIDNYDKAKHSLTIGATTNKGTLNATSHTFTSDGSFDFIATDSLGNTATKRETVTGLATGTPSVVSTDITGGGSTNTASPITFIPSTTNPTNNNVNVTINYPSYEVTKQYKIGTSGNWTNYTGAITLTTNDTIFAKATDSNGVINQNIFTVNNIDKIIPTLKLTLDSELITNKTVTITATASDNESGIKSITKPDGSIISGSTTSYTVNKNGTYTFSATDIAGNIVSTSITINNIIAINTISGIDHIEYKLEGATTQDWTTYNSLTIINEGITTISARAVDKAGNYSDVVTSVVKLDRSAPINSSIKIVAY